MAVGRMDSTVKAAADSTASAGESGVSAARPSQPTWFAGLRIVAAATLLSRVLGLLRDTALARVFGLTPIGDAFLFAFRIPNLARRLFGEGALSAAFLPVFARVLPDEKAGHGDRRTAWVVASGVFAALAAVLALLTLVGEGILWGLTFVDSTHPEWRLLLGLTAVMLPYAVLICLAAQVTAVLQGLDHFTVPALVPVALNVCLILAAWGVVPWLTEPAARAYALAWCVVVSGVVQLVLQIPVMQRFGYRFNWDWQCAKGHVQEVAWAMAPVTLGLSITQINTFLDSAIAMSLSASKAGAVLWPGGPAYPLQAGAVSALYFGERMYQFPLGVFGVALSTVLFPRMSQHVARGDMRELQHDLTLGMRLVLTIGLPASAGLMLLATPITALLFQSGEFTAEDAARTAAMIATYSAGIWAYCGIPILYRGFYALADRQTPVRVGLLAVACDSFLNLTLIWPLAERGLALSTVLTAVVQLLVLTWALQSRIGNWDWSAIRGTAIRASLCTLFMSTLCAAVLQWPLMSGETRTGRLFAVVAPVLLGIASYFVAAKIVGLREIWWLIRREKP